LKVTGSRTTERERRYRGASPNHRGSEHSALTNKEKGKPGRAFDG